MTKVMRFLGIEHTYKRISLLAAVSLVYQATPVVPTVIVYLSKRIVLFVDLQSEY